MLWPTEKIKQMQSNDRENCNIWFVYFLQIKDDTYGKKAEISLCRWFFHSGNETDSLLADWSVKKVRKQPHFTAKPSIAHEVISHNITYCCNKREIHSTGHGNNSRVDENYRSSFSTHKLTAFPLRKLLCNANAAGVAIICILATVIMRNN